MVGHTRSRAEFAIITNIDVYLLQPYLFSSLNPARFVRLQ